jgi:predicted nucleotidyltransferase
VGILLALAIVKVLKDHIEQIKQLCNTYHVKSLFAFGSVVQSALNGKRY